MDKKELRRIKIRTTIKEYVQNSPATHVLVRTIIKRFGYSLREIFEAIDNYEKLECMVGEGRYQDEYKLVWMGDD